MTEIEKSQAAFKFSQDWKDRGDERQHCILFWTELLEKVFGITDISRYIEIEKAVKTNKQNYIDVYIPSVNVLIEQKSINIDLNKKYKQSNGEMLTAYEQAKKYDNDLPRSERAKFIITCNFRQFYIYDMEYSHPEPTIVDLLNLEKEYHRLNILVGSQIIQQQKEEEISIKAGELVSQIYDSLIKQYKYPQNEATQKSLNILCVRLVFCLYAEDSGVFPKHLMFHDYFIKVPANKFRKELEDFFKVLNTKKEERNDYIEEELNDFPYVNGGLFEKEIDIPQFTDEIIDILLNKASAGFNWSEISPTIFGAVFESTLNSEKRHSGGIHYTTIKDIHKVIDPLFLNDLTNEYNEIINRKQKNVRIEALHNFQDKLASLKFLDPACGSGNFLTETFMSLRRLENKLIRFLHGEGLLLFKGIEDIIPIKVKISQFYGIEIDDFAFEVAKTALWIAEHQMLKETENIFNQPLKFLPLRTNAYIHKTNALCIDWNKIISKDDLNYIISNPPFVGARNKDFTKDMKADIKNVFGNIKGCGNLDYVSGWYKKAADYITDTNIKVAFISTNSITQGEQVPILWKPLFKENVHIDFAWKTFKWENESTSPAAVHCVIIGFSKTNDKKLKNIFECNYSINTPNINGYLCATDNIFIENISDPIYNVPKMLTGNMPNDCKGKLSNYSTEKMNQIINSYPQAKPMFKRFVGADEFINKKERWCLWLLNTPPKVIQSVPPIMQAIQDVCEGRKKSNRNETRMLANTPMLFGEIRQPSTDYVFIPRHSAENRKYIPIGYEKADTICGDSAVFVPNSKLYHFGILTSSVHMIWVNAICGRIKSDYRYSIEIVYNNFPWCNLTPKQQMEIEQTAQAILNAREQYLDSSLSDMYGKNMFLYPELIKAHQANDKAVMKAYGFKSNMTENDIIIELMKMYKNKILSDNS